MKSQEDVLTKLEEKVQKSGDATAELGSHLQSLINSLKCKSKVQDMFEEALKLPNTSVSEHSARPSTGRVMDSAIQTSPGLEQSAYNILQDNKLKGTQLTCASYNLEQNLVEVPPQDHFRIIGKKKFKQSGYSRRKKRPLVFSQRRKGAVSDENSQPLVNRNKQQTPLCERCDLNAVTNQGLNPDCMKRETKSSATAGCLITPVSWSQDSSSSVCLSGIDPILEKLSAESNAGTLVKPEGLWQLFDSDFDF
ncbi:uncharacterized protein [Brachyistius frenatus]|uniref:uncharacterized protein n=1 Tax=Brachyistius frenatus TaxID=100188 RepID=UPI0037E93947